MKPNCLIAQSGGPTAVINNSVCGVVQEALKQQMFDHVYGALFGIKGFLDEKIIDVGKESETLIENFRYTPGAVLGTSRHKITKTEEYLKILEIFKKYDIRYFFYIGGNDSMDTSSKIHQMAVSEGYDLKVIGVPKTVDNDLPFTDHTPGYGSAAKYIATTVQETAIDLFGAISSTRVYILEAMGRNAGWLTASSALGKITEEDAPHLIYLPEPAFDVGGFLKDVEDCYKRYGDVYVVISEGLKGADGQYVYREEVTDSFGHAKLGGGLANYLKEIVEKELGYSTRSTTLGTSQRSAIHYASKVDADEAYQVGVEAVRLAADGASGVMVTLDRSDEGGYHVKMGQIELQQVANQEKKVPASMINARGNGVTEEFIRYARPLIQGNLALPMKDGLPDFARMNVMKDRNNVKFGKMK